MSIVRLRDFVAELTRVVPSYSSEAFLLERVVPLVAELIAHDDWLPEVCARPDPVHYQQYLLHCDPLQRFSVVSFVWGPDQQTPIHDHTVWGVIGMLRGAEISTGFVRDGSTSSSADEPLDTVDRAQTRAIPLREGETIRLEPGDVEQVSPRLGDIHRVRNAFDDRVSISIHVYGANIGAVRRHIFDPATGATRPFVSGFSAAMVPNLWSS
jgi:predicted metal-dependent enzyme (double-stranded beta helix superfamily)